MRHQVRMLGICLAAVFAIGAIGAVAASAKLPEWGTCEATPGNTGGKYGNANCTAPVKAVHGEYYGGYEWTPLPESDERGESASGPAYPGGSPVKQTGMKLQLADGRSITCSALRHETEVELTGPSSTKRAPRFEWEGCHDDQGGKCFTAFGLYDESIGDFQAWEHGGFNEPGTWTGSLRFIEGKSGPAGIRYEAENEAEAEPGTIPRLFQQIVCEEPTDISAVVVGGHKKHETLPAAFSPLNTMTGAYTVTLSQSNGTQLPAKTKLYAQANGGAWQTVGIEATMQFPRSHIAETLKNELELKTIK